MDRAAHDAVKSRRRYWIIGGIYAGALLGMGAAIYMRVAAESKDPKKYSQEAIELHRDGRFGEAVRAYEQSLALQDDAVLRASLSRALVKLGQLERAVRELEAASLTEPTHAEIWHDLALLRWRGQNDLAGAEAAFARAAALLTCKPEVEFDRGMLLLSMQRWEEAAACFESALARAPANAAWRAQAEESLVVSRLKAKSPPAR